MAFSSDKKISIYYVLYIFSKFIENFIKDYHDMIKGPFWFSLVKMYHGLLEKLEDPFVFAHFGISKGQCGIPDTGILDFGFASVFLEI